ncbi:MAG: carboxypeptidase regulatory-like domain-containing protein [Myxococcaceae bacterium]|nr:carboxypeptidase regulatory-like domain-containing protein [Myxococcaceae bacterium]
MRICVLVGLLAAAPSLAQPAEALHPDGWTEGRALVTLGGVFRSQTQGQTATAQAFSTNAPFLLLSQALTATWYSRSWFGVQGDVRIDPFRFFQQATPPIDLTNQDLVNERSTEYRAISGNLLGLLRWQAAPSFGLELQGGWAMAGRPYMRLDRSCPQGLGRLPTDTSVQSCAAGILTTGPIGGVAANLDLGRHLWLQLYGRAEYILGLEEAAAWGRLRGPGITGGLQARFGSFGVGPFEFGVGLLLEVAWSNLVAPRLPDGPENPALSTILGRASLGGAVTLRRPVTATTTTGPERKPRGIAGRVLKADRSPVTGASVSVGPRAVVSDAAGAFEVTDLTPGTFEVKASAPGLRSASVSVVVAEGLTETELVLEAPTGPGRVTGVVRAAPDKPLAGAKVVSGAKTTTTQASGAYTLDGVGPGPVQLRVMLDGYVPADEAVQVPPEATATLDVTLELAAQRTKAKLRGVISSAAGPVAKATVRVVELKLKQAVKADGRFEVEVPGGKYTLVIEAPKHVTQTKQVEVADGDQAIFQIELEKLR